MKTWKSHGILKQQFPSLDRFGKINKLIKFWKSNGNLLHNPLYNRIMFNYVLNFSAVDYCAYIALLIPAAFTFKMREIPAKHLFNTAYRS